MDPNCSVRRDLRGGHVPEGAIVMPSMDPNCSVRRDES